MQKDKHFCERKPKLLVNNAKIFSPRQIVAILKFIEVSLYKFPRYEYYYL